MLSDLECLTNKDESYKQVRKEETKSQITSDNKNRKKLENFTKTCIHPLDLESHKENSLCNVDTGKKQLLMSMSIKLLKVAIVN